MHTLPRSVVLGVGAGFVSGLFGVGGGLIVVPGLVLLMAFDQHRAHATSVAAIVASAAAAAVPFAAGGEVRWGYAWLLLTGSLAGAVVGARIIGHLSPVWLARALVVLALVAAARLGLAS